MCHIHALEEYCYLYNENQQMHMYKICFITLLYCIVLYLFSI